MMKRVLVVIACTVLGGQELHAQATARVSLYAFGGAAGRLAEGDQQLQVTVGEVFASAGGITTGITALVGWSASSVAIQDDSPTAARMLDPIFPNPASRLAQVRLRLDTPTYIRLDIFDAMGRRVATLERGMKAAGVHLIPFDASQLRSGVYFYRIEGGGTAEVRRLVVL